MVTFAASDRYDRSKGQPMLNIYVKTQCDAQNLAEEKGFHLKMMEPPNSLPVNYNTMQVSGWLVKPRPVSECHGVVRQENENMIATDDRTTAAQVPLTDEVADDGPQLFHLLFLHRFKSHRLRPINVPMQTREYNYSNQHTPMFSIKKVCKLSRLWVLIVVL